MKMKSSLWLIPRTLAAIALCGFLSAAAAASLGWRGLVFAAAGMYAGALVTWAAAADIQATIRRYRSTS